MAEFLSTVLQTLVFAAIAFGVTAAVASHLRYRALTGANNPPPGAAGAGASAQIELDPRQAFLLRLSTYLGSLHKEPPPFSLVLVSLGARDQLEAAHGPDFAAAAMGYAVERIRGAIRKGDACQQHEPGTLGVILSLKPDRAEAVVRRLAESVTHGYFSGPGGVSARLGLRAGVASFPADGTSAEALFRSAEQALAQTPDVPEGLGLQMLSLPATAAEDAVPAPHSGDTPPPAPDGRRDAAGASSLLDELTGVLRPDRLGGAMQKFIARHRKSETPASLVVVDIDSLRRYNDHYGRAAGDEILRGVSRILQKTCREDDLIGRIEDEEFLVCMDCAPAAAETAAQRIVAEIKREPITHAANKLRVTACAGVAGYPDDGGAPRVLFEKAEIALLNAKSRGRAVVTKYQDNLYRPRKSSQMVLDRF